MAKLIIVLCLIGFVWGKEPFTLDEFLQNTLVNLVKGWNGVWDTEDSFIYKNADGKYMEYNAFRETEEPFLNMDHLAAYPEASFKVSSDRKYILIRYNVISIFRHSTTAQYAIHNLVESGVDIHIADKAHLQYCEWTPSHNGIVYVLDNDIYYHADVDAAKQRVTTDGKPRIVYNGVPDWVYEEEVLSSGSAMWLSPNGNNLAFLQFDDTDVETFTYYLYGDPGTMESQYPTLVDLKYPKVGRKNPKFRLKYVDLTASILKVEEINVVTETEDHVVWDVTWANDEKIVVLYMNRIQNEGKLLEVQFGESKKELATYKETNGWLEVEIPTFKSDGSFYIQLEPLNNFPRLSITKNGEKEQLTDGNKTVTSIYGLDETKDLVYFAASGENDHAQQHVYSVNVETKEEKCLTCNMETPSGICEYATASFSKDMSYITKICQGPGPNYVIIDRLVLDDDKTIIWEQNSELLEKLENKFIPEIKDLTITLSDGFTAAVRLLLPPNLDQNKAYPMVVNVYAGPNSNQIKDAFSLGIENYMVTNREYIYAYIDGRGSGRRGNDLMFQVYKRLGNVEIEDQIYVTKELQSRFPYIDRTRTCIWGWSYGGFSTAWAMVKDTESIFKCGLSVAPVTSFIYYDSIYTERYMDIPQDNPEGYDGTDVTRHAKAFENKSYFLIHGNGDDNVHYQQAMMLARALEVADVPFTQMSYPDENHSLRGVSPHLYHAIDKYWADNFYVKGGIGVIIPSVTLTILAVLFNLFRM